MKAFLILLLTLLLAGCAATDNDSVNEQYQSLSLQESALKQDKWAALNRFAPMYPISKAKARAEGCATVEYVVTPEYEVTAVKVVDSTSIAFAKEAQKVITKWKWENLPRGLLATPLKTQTRFDFCLRDGSGRCDDDVLAKTSQCRGEDMVPAVGSVVRKATLKL
jgi:TonB family protein